MALTGLSTALILRCLLALCFSLLIPTTDSCGTMTHTEIGERTSEFFNVISEGIDYKRMLKRHPDALQAGSPYPDAYYSGLCYGGIYHDISEDTHWTPYLNASIHYIRRQYPRPWDIATEKLVVFLLGIVMHQISDITWHSLGIQQGFLDTMGKLNFHGSFQEAHNNGDFGGDVINVFELDMSYVGMTNATWYVPIDDLVNIYDELYNEAGRMPISVVENCTTLLFLGRLGENIGAIDLLYPLYSSRSPFLLDGLNNYFYGGQDDMAVWSGNIWRETVTMLDRGTSGCDLPHNPLFIKCNQTAGKDGAVQRPRDQGQSGRGNPGVSRDLMQSMSSLVSVDDIDVFRTDRGMYLSPKKHLMKKVRKKLMQRRKKYSQFISTMDVEQPNNFYSTAIQYSRLGQTVISGDINNDGHSDVIISAPSYSSGNNYEQGRIYILYGSASGVDARNITMIERSANLVLTGFKLNGRFGQSVAVVDVNLDGRNDLVVGAPSVGSETLSYHGELYVYLAGPGGNIATTPNITVTCTDVFCNLGFSLASGDVNGDGNADIVVSSPYAASGGAQRGMVGALYSDVKFKDGDKLTQTDLDWVWRGEQNYDWFGYSVSVRQTSTGDVWLVAGAPSYRICAIPDCSYNKDDVQAVGKVYAFKVPDLGTPVTIMDGRTEFEQFGFDVDVAVWNNTDVLVVTAVSAELDDVVNMTQVGSVQLFRIHRNGIDTEPLLTFTGDRQFDRFGFSSAIYNANAESYLLTSAPYRSEDLRLDRESGKLFMLTGVDTSAAQAYRTFGTSEIQARFGASFAIVSSVQKTQLVVGAPHSNSPVRLGGKIALFEL